MISDEKQEINVLVIGNGLDISLGYPTKYADFLDFCKVFSYILAKKKYAPCQIVHKTDVDGLSAADIPELFDTSSKNIKINYDVIVKNEDLEKFSVFKKVFKVKGIDKIVKKFGYCIYNNWWIEYFKERYKTRKISGENWIDIENEIKIVINKFEKQRNLKKYFKNVRVDDEKTVNINLIGMLNIIDNNEIKELAFSENCEKALKIFIKNLREHYDNFITALGIYLNYFAFGIEDNTPNVRQLAKLANKIQYILCFNYKDNYKNNYIEGEYVEDCMVHGQLHYNIHNDHSVINDMVIGFQNMQDNTDDLTFVYYQKYFQRIVKGTGNKYLSWFNKAELAGKRINVYIFGHSLDPTDEEILKPLFLFNDVHFTIFYREDFNEVNNDLEQKVMNLIRILGKNNLIKFTSGEDPLIKFEKQIEIKK